MEKNLSSFKLFLLLIVIINIQLASSLGIYLKLKIKIVKFDGDGTVDLIQKDENTISFTYKLKKGTWAGIGFGKSMENTDMHVVNAFTNGEFEVLDTYSFGHAPPSEDNSIGGTNNLKDIKKEQDLGDYIIISYSRLLDTNDQYDYVFKTVKLFNKL